MRSARPRARFEIRRPSRTRSAVASACAAALVASAAAACSSSSGPASSSGQTQAAANITAAKAQIAPYSGAPSAFPITQPLSKPLPAGTKFAFLQCGTSACGLVASLLAPAIKDVGGALTTINAGETAQSSQAAVASVLALKPAAVLISGIDPTVFGGDLKQLSAAGIKVITISVSKDTQPYGITFNYIGLQTTQTAGKSMADWVIANKGGQANVVFYTVPEIDLSTPLQQAFQQELAKNCPACKIRTVPIDVSTLGTTAPSTVVTDLQSHPDTTVAVFASAEVAAGLPAAMKAAGLSTTTLGYAPQAGIIQNIKNGQITAGLAVDFPLSVWVAVDAAARLIEGGQPTAYEQAGDIPIHFLDQQNITFNPAGGWAAYPDYQQRFAALWNPAS